MSRRRGLVLLAAAGGLVLLAMVGLWPVRTRAGVNYVVTERTIPLWRKATEFVERDRLTRRLADSLIQSEMNDEERAFAVLHWTNASIRPHPDTVPVLDDHVWSIIERGYGSNDQQADVFTTLLTYAGVPAYWRLIGPNQPAYPISFALIDGRWRVFDVERSIAFRNAGGALATPEELVAAPEIVRRSAESLVPAVDAYVAWFDVFEAKAPPSPLRAEMHMPHKRFAHEVRKFISRLK